MNLEQLKRSPDQTCLVRSKSPEACRDVMEYLFSGFGYPDRGNEDTNPIPVVVVPHKAVAEVSKIGSL